MNLTGHKILLGVTGGIAAYKAAYLARLLVKAEAEVQVVMTEAAVKFIAPLTFEALTDREVAVEMFPERRFVSTRHVSFAQWPDMIVVAPATADIIAQAANGFCPSLLAAIICATRRPVIWAPAMNEGMYANPAVQKNIAALREHGHLFAEVGVGEMACKSYGPGRMAEPDEIFELIVRHLHQGPLAGKKVLVTAGACREPLDPVRFISNRSSGKMGFAMAREARRLGAEVTLITGPVALPDPPGMAIIRVETTEEMARAVEEEFSSIDYLVMAAAPADYKPKTVRAQKIKKGEGELNVELTPTVDILKKVASRRHSAQVVIGFSLETEHEIEHSQVKLKEKNLDYIVVNNPRDEGAGFDTDTNRVTVLSKAGGVLPIAKADKEVIARTLWEYFLTDGTG
jgi:phosphopantothenoylcysteine decarboxylase/phosphopantothenate--cysteine ligase